MKRLVCIATLLCLITTANSGMRLCTSTNGACTQRVIECIKASKTSIMLQAYNCNTPTTEAVASAWKRGVKVQVVQGKARSNDNNVKSLLRAGVPVVIVNYDVEPVGLMVVDGKIAFIGPFKTPGKFRNAEGMLFSTDSDLLSQYNAILKHHLKQAKP